MNTEFKKSKQGLETRYTLESASSGGTSAGAVASISSPIGGIRKRGDNLIAQEEQKEPPKPRNFVAKNAKMGGAGAHKDKKKDQKQGKEKHKKPYMEDLKDRISELKTKLDEVSLGDYSKKAKMAQALGSMSKAFGNDQSPEQKAKLQHKIDRREIGLGRAKARTDKMASDMEAKRKAEYEQSIRDKYANVDIDAEIAKLKPAIQSAYNDYQYGARNTWSDGRDRYNTLKAKVQELERAKEILAQDEVDEDAPFLAKAAGGIALGALGAAGAPAIVGLLGPVIGTALAAYGAYNSAKGGMWAVDKLWDLAAKKLGGQDKAEQFAKAHAVAASRGEDSFDYAGKEFPVKLKPNEVKPAIQAIKKVSEDHSTMSQGYGRESASTGQAFAGRMKGAIPEDTYIQNLFDKLNEGKKKGADGKACWDGYRYNGTENGKDKCVKVGEEVDEDWQKVNRRDKTDGMSRKAVKAYRRENPGSKLKTAVTTKPSKLKKGGKAAKRRKSFCARMSGNKGPMKKPNGKPTPKALALRRWNCEEDAYMNSLNAQVLEKLNPQAPTDVWVKDFQKADPNKYHQFKNKTPAKKAQMAVAAHYAANEPSKKK